MDFALVAPMVIGLCLAVVQIGMWVVAMTTAHRVAFTAAREAAATSGDDARRVQVALDIIRRESPVGMLASARIDREAVDVGGFGGGDMVIVELTVPLRLWDWQSPVRGSVSALVPVEPG